VIHGDSSERRRASLVPGEGVVCASLLIASGASVDEVQHQMGHATEAFTKRVYGNARELHHAGEKP
jgi:integrase